MLDLGTKHSSSPCMGACGCGSQQMSAQLVLLFWAEHQAISMSPMSKEEELYFCSSYDALGAYRQKRINLDNPFWLWWRLDQRVIGSREVPIEVQYESLGTYHEIYGHYLIVGSVKKEICSIYIRTTIGHVSFYREIEEAVQGFCRAYSYTI